MGTEYRRWFIPKGNTFCPGGAAIAKLVLKLRKEGWLSDPASPSFQRLGFDNAPLAAKTGGFAKRAVAVTTPRNRTAGWEALPLPLEGPWIDHPSRSDLMLRWPVHPRAVSWDWSAVHYPLTRVEDVAPPAGFDLELHRADDFVYPISQGIEPIATTCVCGEDLAFEWDDDEIQSPFGATTGIFKECEECSRTFDPSGFEADVTEPFTGKKSRVRGGAAYRFAIVVDCGKRFPEGGAAPEIHPDLKALCEAEFGRDFYEIGAID